MSETTSNDVHTGAQPRCYMHIIAPPYIPTQAPNQRYFNTARHAQKSCCSPVGKSHIAETLVLRFAGSDFAKVEFSIFAEGVSSSFTLKLGVHHLREMAGRLLDAAYDIETNPAEQVSLASQHLEHIEKAA